MNTEKNIYLEKLDELGSLMSDYDQTPFANFAKVFCLATMNMRYEKVAFDLNLEEHPYISTKKIIEDTIDSFANLMDLNFIEDKNNSISSFKSNDLVKKHQSLWQEIWSRHDDKEFRNFIDLKAMRIEVNDLTKYVAEQDCVEFGCGNGSFSFALLEKGASSVKGIDFGKKSVEYAKNYSTKMNLDSKAEFFLREVFDSGFNDEQFGFAVSNGVFHHLIEDKIPEALIEVARVLKKGGWFWYYVDGEGAISMDLWDKSVEILKDLDINEIERCLIPLNIKREKMVHIMDSLNATYLHTTWEKVTELLASCGFHNFKRLTGATSTDFDEDVVNKDPYGKEKFGGGDLRIACQKL